jgi:hypothetical protein
MLDLIDTITGTFLINITKLFILRSQHMYTSTLTLDLINMHM